MNNKDQHKNSIDYINDINNIEELRKEFRDLWDDYCELNHFYTALSMQLEELGEI